MFDLIKGLKKGDHKAEATLYKYLYAYATSIFEQIQVDINKELEVFQDSFLIFTQRIRKKGFVLPKGRKERQKKMVEGSFKLVLLDQLFDFNRSVYRVLSGVRQGHPVAIKQLVKGLNHQKVLMHAEKLARLYPALSLDGIGIISELLPSMIDLIKEEKFTLEEDLNNTFNQNRLFKYFKEFLFRRVYREGNKKKLPIEPVEPPEASDEMKIQPERLPSLMVIKRYIRQLEEKDRTLLIAYYWKAMKPAQIAKQLSTQGYDTSEKIKERLAYLLEQLGRQLNMAIEEGELAQEELTDIYLEVIVTIEEPCRTILVNSLPPKSKKIKEISQILKEKLPDDMLTFLRSSDQIRRRRFKCMSQLKEKFWKKLLGKKVNDYG